MGIGLNSLFGQGFGKNKVQYSDFKWEYIQSKHFDVYFTEGGREIAEFAATAAESAYVTISYTLRWELQERISFIIYNLSFSRWYQQFKLKIKNDKRKIAIHDFEVFTVETNIAINSLQEDCNDSNWFSLI